MNRYFIILSQFYLNFRLFLTRFGERGEVFFKEFATEKKLFDFIYFFYFMFLSTYNEGKGKPRMGTSRG